MRYNEAQYNTYSHDHKIDYEPTIIKIVYVNGTNMHRTVELHITPNMAQRHILAYRRIRWSVKEILEITGENVYPKISQFWLSSHTHTHTQNH